MDEGQVPALAPPEFDDEENEMPTEYRCIDGSIWVDERLTVNQWIEKTHGPDARLLELALSGDDLIATIALPGAEFPFEQERIHFAKVPEDVTFSVKQLSGGEFSKKYFADRDQTGRRVFVCKGTELHKEIVELDPVNSQAVVNHSPDGFEWSYSGSGPSQLALAILLDVFGDKEIASQHYQDFKTRFIANLPVAQWEIREDDIRQWIKNADKGVLF